MVTRLHRASHLARVGLLLGLTACVRSPPNPPEPGPLRLPIDSPEYGAHPTHAQAVGIGERLALGGVELAEGGRFELSEALAAGPVILVWVGGAEHEGLMTWVQALDRALPELDARGATLVFARPLEPEAALRWAVELRLQTTVVSDREQELAGALDLLRLPDRDQTLADFAVLILGEGGRVDYRKLGSRRPSLDELARVLDGFAGQTRCCPGTCVGSPCD